MVRRHDADQIERRKVLGRDLLMMGRAVDEPQVDALLHRHIHDFNGGPRSQHHGDMGVQVEQGLQRAWQHAGTGSCNSPNDPAALPALAHAFRYPLHRLQRGQGVSDLGQQGAPIGREREPAVLACEQLQAQSLFGLPQQRARRRLGHAYRSRRSGHGARTGNRADERHLSLFHTNFRMESLYLCI